MISRFLMWRKHFSLSQTVRNENPASREKLGYGQRFLCKKILATDLIHSGSACRALAFHFLFASFHSDFDRIWVFSLCSTFHTIHTCHIISSPPLKKNAYVPLIFQYIPSSTNIAMQAKTIVLIRSWRITVNSSLYCVGTGDLETYEKTGSENWGI